MIKGTPYTKRDSKGQQTVCLASPTLLGALSYLNRETMKPIHYIIYSARHTSRFKSLLLTLKVKVLY